MRYVRYILCIVGIVMASPYRWAAAGPVDPNHLPALAAWYLHIDMEAARKTALFKEIREEVNTKVPLEDTLAQIRATLGFDPLADIKGITLYGTSFTQGVGALLIYGKLDQGGVQTMIAGNPGYAQGTHGKHIVHTWADKGKQPACSFYNPELIVLGDSKETVTAALDVLDGKTRGGSTLVKQQPPGVIACAAAAGLRNVGDEGLSRLLAASEEAMLSIAEIEGKTRATLAITFRTPEIATQMGKLAEGLRALLILNAQKGPVAADVASQITTSVEGTRVSATFECESTKLLGQLRALQEEHQRNKQAAAATPAPRR